MTCSKFTLLATMTVIATMFQHSAALSEEPAANSEPADDAQPVEEPGTSSESVGTRERFNIIGAERQGEAIQAYDVEASAQVDREDANADFWLKSNDPRVAGGNYGIEALNGALVAPDHPGQSPDSVPESGFVTFGSDVRQDDSIPCKTSSGRLCELSAHYYELSAGGSDVVVTITLY